MTDEGLAVGSVILAIPGIIDLCIQYGQFLKDKVDSYRHMNDIVRLDHFVVQLVEGELHTLLMFFKSIHDRMTTAFEDETLQLFQVLRNLLEAVKQQFPRPDPGKLEKLSFSFHGRKALAKACRGLEDWHERFLRRAVVFLFFGGHDITDTSNTIDDQNRAISRIKRIRDAVADLEPVSQAVSKLNLGTLDDTTIGQRVDDSEMYEVANGQEVIEFRPYDYADTTKANKIRIIVRNLAAKLNRVDPSVMGLLACNGYSTQRMPDRFALRFQYPTGKTNPHTLHHILVDKSNKSGIKHSMSDRINLARKIASAVLYLHSCNFVHKNIRPTNIIIFDPIPGEGTDPERIKYPYAVGEPYIVGFDSIRTADGHTDMILVEDWEKNIYLHPDRHRMNPGDEFTMRHDIYSLGVVLLEISLWGSFTDRSGIGKYLWEDVKSSDEGKKSLRTAEGQKAMYLMLAHSLLPRAIGNKYRDVVISCLEGLQSEEQGGLLNDQDGIVVGSAYISQIMGKLEEIAL